MDSTSDPPTSTCPPNTLRRWARVKFQIRNKLIVETIAEFFATFIVVLFAVGSSAQHVLMPNEPFIMEALGAVTGLLIAIASFGGLSGAHVNPLISMAFALAGDMSWSKVPFYWGAQFGGAYLGAGLAFAIYQHHLCISDGNVCSEAIGIFSPLPATPLTTGLLDQIVTVTCLVIFVFAVIDPKNMRIPKCLHAPLFAMCVTGITLGFKINAGAVLNPARDLGPRLMALTLGHSYEALFLYKNESYWLIPLLGPMLGGILGTVIYIFFVECQLDGRDDDEETLSLDESPRGSLDSSNWRSAMLLEKGRVCHTIVPTSPYVGNRMIITSHELMNNKQGKHHIGNYYWKDCP